METYRFPSREIPRLPVQDIVIIGGGPAGCAAAIAAGRLGARVLLVESTFALGGMGTSGLVPAWCPFSDKQKIIYRGIAEEIFLAAKAKMPHIPADALDWVAVDAEILKRVYDDKVQEAGVTVRFGTTLGAVETDGDAVTALILADKSGLSAVQASLYLDCTGDADLCAMAGVETQQGEQGNVMPSTLCFRIAGINMEAFEADERRWLHPNHPNSIVYAIAKDDRYPDITDEFLCNSYMGGGIMGFNAGHLWNVDATDPEALSQAVFTGRRIAEQFRDALEAYFPEAFAGTKVVATAPLVGVRESRRIVGDYVLTVLDYQNRASFPDEIGRNCYYIDVHMTPEEAAACPDADKAQARYAPGESHGIPYRCLVPQNRTNLLVAGRCISADRRLQASVRVMPTCLVTGQAAGTAAVLALRGDGNAHHVDTEALRQILWENGAWFQ